MAKLTQAQSEVLTGLYDGRQINEYPTRTDVFQTMFRWTDTHEVVNMKTVMALRKRGYDIYIPYNNQVVTEEKF